MDEMLQVLGEVNQYLGLGHGWWYNEFYSPISGKTYHRIHAKAKDGPWNGVVLVLEAESLEDLTNQLLQEVDMLHASAEAVCQQ